jgi:hypothetical protein
VVILPVQSLSSLEESLGDRFDRWDLTLAVHPAPVFGVHKRKAVEEEVVVVVDDAAHHTPEVRRGNKP